MMKKVQHRPHTDKITPIGRGLSGRLLILLFTVVLLAACSAKSPYKPVADVVELPQDALAYVDQSRSCPPERQQMQETLSVQFVERFFSPWHRDESIYPKDVLNWGESVYGKKTMFGMNTLPLDSCWISNLTAVADMESYPNAALRAITVRNTSMRVLPTGEPAFYDFARAGEGFPFDYMQNTGIWAGSPLHISNISADGAWVLAENGWAFGWIPSTDIAFADDAFIAAYESNTLQAFVKDNAPIVDESNVFRFKGRIGLLLPADEKGRLLVPARDADGQAVIRTALPPAESTVAFPLPMTDINIATIANQLLGQPYGWGGLYGRRDCSATILDLFAVFGIPMPRNSKQQADAYRHVSLEGLPNADKQAQVRNQATPFMTLLTMRGHILLYLGTRNGKAIALHSTWGVKTEDHWQKEGRKVIGATVITTLEPGAELPELKKPSGSLLHKLSGLTFIGQVPEE